MLHGDMHSHTKDADLSRQSAKVDRSWAPWIYKQRFPQNLENLRSPPLTMAEVTCLSYTFDTAFTDLDFDSFPLDLLSEVPTTLSTSPEHEAAGNMAAEANCGMDVDMTSMEPPSVQDSPVMTRSERSAPILRERSSADGTTLSSKTPAKDHALVIGTTQDTDPQPGMTTTPLPRSGSGHGPPQTYSVAREQADEAKGNDSAELLLDVDESLIQNRGRETTGSVKRIHELGEAALPQDPLAHVPIATPAPHHDDELEHTAEEGSSSEAILIGASALVPDGHGPEPSASAVMCSEAVAVASSPETTICKTFIVLAAPEEVTATSVEHVGSDGNTTMPHVTPEVTGPGKHGSLDVILTPMSRPPSTMNLRSTKRLAKGSQGESNGMMTCKPLLLRC